MISFSRRIKEIDLQIDSVDYSTYATTINKASFVYLDPPYRLTTGSYNDGKRGFKGWNKETELQLLRFLDSLTSRNINFMLSYVIEHKGKQNIRIIEWIKNNKLTLIPINSVKCAGRKEVIILNYQPDEKATLHNQQQLPKTTEKLQGHLEL